MCIEVDIDALYENQKSYYAQQAAEAMDKMFQCLGHRTTRKDWFCGLTDEYGSSQSIRNTKRHGLFFK